MLFVVLKDLVLVLASHACILFYLTSKWCFSIVPFQCLTSIKIIFISLNHKKIHFS